MKLTIKVDAIAEKMVNTLADAAASCVPPVYLNGINAENYHTEIDERFKDGGEARCERFLDVGWEYANQFGQFRDDEIGPWHDAHQRAIKAALKLLEKRYPEPTCIPFKDFGSKTDKYGHEWPENYVVCSVCGQPDDCGDCNHAPLSDEEAKVISALINARND